MRHLAVMLMIAIAVSGCGEGDTAETPETTHNRQTPTVGGVTTRHDDECTYEGPTEFDVNSDVTFTFINASETPDIGFQVVKVDEGTTKEAIYEFGVGSVSNGEGDDWYEPYLPTPTAPGIEYAFTVTLDKVGLHAIVCFQHPAHDEPDKEYPNYASTLFTVKG
jgi:hypothetical protein